MNFPTSRHGKGVSGLGFLLRFVMSNSENSLRSLNHVRL
ncbi:hypothetical protein GXM_00810 [Nostoc sphaeroides CCNUC1]|uniref:Uncharacterized protein n=1 Tax=Nostoc sphaeroides CCNUC1 TaxID=2653204 RepID=A0A5P8VSL8_9NOSO|nr:hypothetical protein GXM_00810 [Nostoc sphaeroides CCNUC1]